MGTTRFLLPPFCSGGILYSGWFIFFSCDIFTTDVSICNYIWNLVSLTAPCDSHWDLKWFIFRTLMQRPAFSHLSFLLLRYPTYLSFWFSFVAITKFTFYLFRSFENLSFVHGMLTYFKAHCLSLTLENSTLYCDLCFYFLFSWLL